MTNSQIQYNKNSSVKYGWRPSWFGADDFDSYLTEKIKQFQKQCRITIDGYCGADTFRRIFVARSEQITELEEKEGEGSHIVYGGNFFDIDWDSVVLWNASNGFRAKENNYRISKTLRKPRIFINHWDVCLTSKMCQDVLDQRGISVHFLISEPDRSGKCTIYQTMDCSDIAYHAGNANSYSIGVEICNPYYTKYDDWHRRNGLPLRPRWTGFVRGKELEEHLGFYDVQIKACQALWRAVSIACDIPLDFPRDDDGKMIDRLYPPALENWKGICHHFHTDTKQGKIDCGGFDLKKYIGE